MSRGPSVSNTNWVLQQSGVSNPASNPMNVMGLIRGSITVRKSPASAGTLAGSIQVQQTDFGTGEDYISALATDWTNVGTAVVFAGTATGIPLATLTGKFIRVVWTDSGSTGGATLDVAFTGLATSGG